MCQVTRANFEKLLPEILSQIDQSLFLAIDTEFSTLEPLISSREKPIHTRQQFYEQRRELVEQLTIFQFGLAIFSFDPSDQHYNVQIYNFSLHPPSISPIDVKYLIQSSSIEFLTEYQFDFNRCFYEGISFINQSQEKCLFNRKDFSHRYSINDQMFFDRLFERINQWLIHADLHEQILIDLTEEKHRIHRYCLQLEIRRCFQTIWTTIDDENRLTIERINKEIYDQRIKEEIVEEKEYQLFLQSLMGFSRLIRSIAQNYRKSIVGHNCFLDWLIIYQKFIDELPLTFDKYQCEMNEIFPLTIFDTKYLALQMKDYLFTRMNTSNFTTLTSLSSLYDLFQSKFYDQSIFVKPQIHFPSSSLDKRNHEAGYDAFMSGIIFLKMIYFYRQKKFSPIDYSNHFSSYQICLNDLQIYQNRFYSTLFSFISLNRLDLEVNFHRKYPFCLVLSKHNEESIDLSDLQCRFHGYGSFEYQFDRSSQQVFLYLSSEEYQRRLLNSYGNHSIYKIEEFHFWKHSIWMSYSRYFSLICLGLSLVYLIEHRLRFFL